MARNTEPFYEMPRSLMSHATSNLRHMVSVMYYSQSPIGRGPVPIDTLITIGSPLVSTKPGFHRRKIHRIVRPTGALGSAMSSPLLA